MNLPILALIAGGVFIALQSKKPSTSLASTKTTSSGVIYKCNSIQIIDKDKFKKFTEDYAQSFIDKRKLQDISQYKYVEYMDGFIQKLNVSCYTKLRITKDADKNSKIIALLLIEKASSAFARKFFKKDFFDMEFQTTNQDFKTWTILSDIGFKDFLELIKAKDITSADVDPLEDLLETNGAKFPL